MTTVQALVEEVPMEINGRVFSKNLSESKFSPRKRRGSYPARQLPNCQPVPKGNQLLAALDLLSSYHLKLIFSLVFSHFSGMKVIEFTGSPP